jgi:hypothetical protein
MKALRTICFCALLVVVLLAGFLIALSARTQAKGSKITKANFDLIIEGMTQEAVEEVFACPPGDYTNGEALCLRCGVSSPRVRKEIWTGYEGDIEVEFSRKDGKVVDKCFAKPEIFPNPTLLDRITDFFQRLIP